ncbi:MAG: 1-acyl-sn-glycerol-3-phosphate acyltransferase [Deltaproteobacteria bacterium]|nr:1-acyl-sn-glycerol-3-phosphate acyltransferase [Candidatus Zymogenaceae bacterium]
MFLDGIYGIILFCIKIGIRLKYRIHVDGIDNVPKSGPAVFICNHTSIVDSFFIGCFLPRKIYFMAKSTEYESAAVRLFLYLSRTFPVRRYDTDPISLKNAMRVLSFGGMVGVYPEGERTWDGEMTPFRNGTIRFLLAAGVPIIPAGISGAFQHQPRWGGKMGNPDIRLSIGRPIHSPKIKGKDQTREDVRSLAQRLVSAVSELTEGHSENR